MNRHRFVPVYFKENFFPFICSTSRSEGTNAIFKDNVGPTTSLILFVQEFDRKMKNIDEKGNLRDKNKAQDVALLHSRYNFERQARDLYNTQIFYRFQQIVKATGMYMVDEIDKNKVYIVYKSETYTEKEIRPRKYLVLVDLEQENYTCICARFQKDGILCSHILRTLIQINRYTLPEKYFIDRWRPIEKKQIRNAATNIPTELRAGSTNTLRYNLISRKFVEVVSDGCMSLERCNQMLQGLEKIHDEIKKIPVRNQMTSVDNGDEQLFLNNGSNNNEQNDSNQHNSEANTMNTNESTRQVAQSSNTMNTNESARQVPQGSARQITEQRSVAEQSLESLKNPDVVPRKGRPKKNIPKSKRWIPTSELVRTKQKITCSRCGSNTHNRATCTADVDDAALSAKKTAASKKRTGTNLKNT